MKAGLAGALVACRDAAASDISGEVLVAAVADEEHASLGIQEVLAHLGAGTRSTRPSSPNRRSCRSAPVTAGSCGPKSR